jgi:RNA polymerase sigma factor (sigma-70 family)
MTFSTSAAGGNVSHETGAILGLPASWAPVIPGAKINHRILRHSRVHPPGELLTGHRRVCHRKQLMFLATSSIAGVGTEPSESTLPPKDEFLPLARAAAAGQREALTTLVLAIGGSVLRTVRKVLGTAHPDVDDVTQDAIIALVAAIPGFRAECTVTHFAHRIAVLTAMAARRRTSTRNRHTERGYPIDEIQDQTSPLATLMAGRRRELVRELLDDLPPPSAEALALHFLLGYTVDEIAAAASLPPNTVWSRLRLGKQALRRRLGSDLRLSDLVGEE